jgi:hypothetical protein
MAPRRKRGQLPQVLMKHLISVDQGQNHGPGPAKSQQNQGSVTK